MGAGAANCQHLAASAIALIYGPGGETVSSTDGDNNDIVSGRGCDHCTLCCKLLEIKQAASPRGEWCRHCEVGVGCKVYAERPSECRDFNCGYLAWSAAGEHWYPARCNMIIVLDHDATRLAIHVDPARPGAWLEQPYYADIKNWARLTASKSTQVVVCVGERHIVILPDSDVDLGALADDERIVTGQVTENGRLRSFAIKMRSDDPRLQA